MIAVRIGHSDVASGCGMSVLSTKVLHFTTDIYRHYAAWAVETEQAFPYPLAWKPKMLNLPYL
ncbi:uncharacterized protein PHALS_03189 [Plasmopara halstedii]|uniref:Uncharacterized protein n=1 Tax=Plasmopara halstedii TaxID=4781 RepID=A0A0P1AY78_PLAHL|nr:uncharacterized protein PHALS_03189 [Plasmopara halstedii]CEG46588.1 hypothetical protein PHALS_03189 [Plasmopara halstedii]|eukprot:XP_024582957.1 hypothetical protein PHALS_03189 [Plasmopara halstedii]